MLGEYFYAMETVRKLIENYDKFGFLYDDEGRIKMKYEMPYTTIEEDGSEGPLCDSEGGVMTDDPFEDENNRLNNRLNLHNIYALQKLYDVDLEQMSGQELLDKYLKYDMPQLLAMLRRGYHYAGQAAISSHISESFLMAMLVYEWRRAVLSTLKKYEGIDLTPRFENVKFDVAYFASKEFREACEREKQQRLEREEELLNVIKGSYSQKEWNNLPSVKMIREIQKAMNGFKDVPNEEKEEFEETDHLEEDELRLLRNATGNPTS